MIPKKLHRGGDKGEKFKHRVQSRYFLTRFQSNSRLVDSEQVQHKRHLFNHVHDARKRIIRLDRNLLAHP